MHDIGGVERFRSGIPNKVWRMQIEPWQSVYSNEQSILNGGPMRGSYTELPGEHGWRLRKGDTCGAATKEDNGDYDDSSPFRDSSSAFRMSSSPRLQQVLCSAPQRNCGGPKKSEWNFLDSKDERKRERQDEKSER